ncbi:MAG: hypothetical protein MK081_16215 [Flavobacteriales bacterium]|nr:hypothetical protein [Flavobacteriales bacterium]
MKSLLTFTVLCFGLSSFGQIDFDKRLLSRFSKEQIIQIEEKSPDIMEFWTYFLDHAYILNEPKPGVTYDFKGTLRLNKDFNLFELDLPHPLSEYEYYQVKGDSRILALVPREVVIRNFNRHRKN